MAPDIDPHAKGQPSSSRSQDAWVSGDSYERYVGRWSRLVAREFIGWLSLPSGGNWLDVGCGTGALSAAILDVASPRGVVGVDPSAAYIAHASRQLTDDRARFEVGDAEALPYEPGSFDAVVSGLALNFVPHPERAVAEMARVAVEDGVVAAYVWDYAGEMQFMRYFWDAAVALDPAADELDEARRFPICRPESLTRLFQNAGLRSIKTRAIDIPTIFHDFDDYWSPFLGGQGPAPGYTMKLDEERRTALRERIRASLPIAQDGSIQLLARAWAVRGSRG
ncbi:MAG: methyltransferase domain-containing protein [Anaerolineae bacterium]